MPSDRQVSIEKLTQSTHAHLLSFAMLLRYSFDLGAEADRLEQAIAAVLKQGYRTADIYQKIAGEKLVNTKEMGAAIIANL